jgi:GTP pyrophosphokinase
MDTEKITRLEKVIESLLAYFPQSDVDIIWKAYVYVAKAHRGQTRLSGSPYLSHPLEVALILTQLKQDPHTVAAGLLHDTIEDTYSTLEEVRDQFGPEVELLVDGVTKISKMKMTFTTSEEQKAENFRKMLLAMAKDIRVILIQLADRLHNMRTILFISTARQKEIAQETLDIYAPLANRLGIGWLKCDLEDLSFRCLYPATFAELQAKIDRGQEARDKVINEIGKVVTLELEKAGIPDKVQGRSKHIYSIYQKMKRDNIDFHEVYDLMALRNITDSIKNCYAILGIIHSLWRPIPGRFKDYIALPKANMYQSLHTTVIALRGERVEFQIRTEEMHRIAEEGIAAHWRYKEGKGGEESYDQKFVWLRHLLEWQQELKDPKEFMDTLKIDLFPEEVYVFTPKGDVKSFPFGSTPVDFAYSIHTDIGNQCVGAKVNSRIVPLKYRIKNGDIVDILTNPRHTPSRDWLKFVKTSRAKNKIRSWIKAEQKERSGALGREILEKEVARHNRDPASLLKTKDLTEIAKRLNYSSPEDLFVAIGFGKITGRQVLEELIPREELERYDREKQISPLKRLVKRVGKKEIEGGVRVRGMDDIFVRFAKCCSPVPGDFIIGYITRGRGISIHTRDCPSMIGLEDDAERKIEVEWEKKAKNAYPVRINIETEDRPGLLGKISSAVASWDVNISWANVETFKDKHAVLNFDIDITDLAHLNKVISTIKDIKGVTKVERIRNPYKYKTKFKEKGF